MHTNKGKNQHLCIQVIHVICLFDASLHLFKRLCETTMCQIWLCEPNNPFHGSASRSIAWLTAAYMLHVAVGEIMFQFKFEKDSFDSQIVLDGKGSRIMISQS